MDDVLRQVVGVFAEEVREQAQKIAAAVLAMETDPSARAAHIEELFRQAHSLKGSSSSLGIEELERLAHNLEEALMPLRRGFGELTPALVDATLRATDAARLRADGLVADSPLGEAEARAAALDLQQLAERGEGVSDTPPAAETQPAETPAAPAAEADPETLRVQLSNLAALERRLDDLRALRGRMDRNTTNATLVMQTLERMWQKTRERARGGDVEPIGPDALYQLLRQVGSLRRDLVDDVEVAQAHAVELDDNLRRMRMVPAVLLGEPLTRAVREACRRSNKDAKLEFTGGDAQIDRRLLEELKNPLIHLVRNAVDHGVESSVVREAVGKPPRAAVTVTVEQRGRDVVIEVRDDGRGVDLTKVRAKAVERALLSAADAERLTEREVYDLLFRPGFSTAEQVTELSGRGVGLDVVRDAIVRLHGRIDLSSQPGQGTSFVLHVPLTIAASETMILEEGGRTFALPLSSVERIVRARPDELHGMGGRTFYHLDDQPIPVVRLSRLLGLTERHEGSPFRTLAVVRGAAARAAVVCERILGSNDLVLRPLPPELTRLPLLGSAAIMPNGQAIFVLAPRALVDAAGASRDEVRPTRLAADPWTILVADDSITTRSLLRNALEASGFRVRVAADGDEALRLALAEPIDLVVSDVRMPRLDGFGLCARLRADPRTAKLPVVLFSSLDSDEDKRRGTASGANAFLTKGAFDRGHLLDVVSSLIRGA